MAAHPLNLVGVHVGGGVFDGRGEIEDDLVVGGRSPDIGDGFADFQGEIELGAGEAFGGVFELQVGAGLRQLRRAGLEERDGIRRDAFDRIAVGVEDVFALGGRGGVIEVEDDVRRPSDGLAGPVDQILAALTENLNRDVGGDAIFLNQAAAEIEFDLGGGGKADLDLGETDANEQVEILQFLFDAHGLGEGLIAIAEVDTAPNGRVGERATGPLAVGQLDRRERAVFRGRGRDGHGNRDLKTERRRGGKPVTHRIDGGRYIS